MRLLQNIPEIDSSWEGAEVEKPGRREAGVVTGRQQEGLVWERRVS